jgi:hypothetical protein
MGRKKNLVRAACELVGFVLALLATSAAGGCKPKPGDRCKPGTATCVDPRAALYCGSGDLYVAVGCKGADGCVEANGSVSCDIGGDAPGEACGDKDAVYCAAGGQSAARCKDGKVDVFQCAQECKKDGKPPCRPQAKLGDECLGNMDMCGPDGTGWWTCKDGKMVLADRCRGPRGCKFGAVIAGALECDTTFGVAGDPCAAGSRCNEPRKAVLACKDGKLEVARACKGPKGCSQGKDPFPDCDSSVADEGDPCDPGQVACSGAGDATLACKSGAFTRDKSCGARRCKAEGKGVACSG